MNEKYITELSYKDTLSELSKMSLRKFIKKHYSYYEETRGVLEQMGIEPKALKNRVTAEELKQFESLGISKNKISMLLNVSVSTLKKVQSDGNIKITPDELQEERDCLQQCINRLRINGYSQEDMAYILCTYVDKLRKDFDVNSEFPLLNNKTEAEKRMLRKAFMTGNLYAELFEDENGGISL